MVGIRLAPACVWVVQCFAIVSNAVNNGDGVVEKETRWCPYTAAAMVPCT
jgi:hypothetical protein